MNTQERVPLAEALLRLTRDLKRSIEAGDVEQMERLQHQREEAMAALFVDLNGEAEDGPLCISLVQEVQQLNCELIGLAKQARDAAGRELAGLRRMRKAESTYVEIYDNVG